MSRGLNRNILECKLSCRKRLLSLWKSLNRNILECKFILTKAVLCTLQRLNRNILECKCFLSAGLLTSGIVLIETYWNVNKYHIIV